MKNRKTIFRMTALAGALLAAYGTALAQEKPLSQTDPDLARLVSPSADDYISMGGGWWSANRAYQGQYDGMWKGGGYLLLDSRIRRRNNETGTWFSLDAHNLGLDTRDIRVGIERQGDIGGYIEYDQIPREYPWTIYTNLQGIGQTNMTVQGNAVPASEVHLGTQRERTSLGFFKYLNSLVPGLKFDVSYRHEDKKGQINYGYGSQPLFLVDPIDSTTQILDAHFSYSKDKLQLRAGGYWTKWDTSNTQLLGLRAPGNGPVPPGTSSRDPNPTPLSQPLDNQSWEVYTDGGYSFTPTTRLMWKAKYGQATMDEQFPSWNLGAPNSPAPGVPQQINGKINTTLLQASLSSRPIPKLAINAALRYYDMHDKTPLVPTAGTPGNYIYNTPQSIRTTSGNVEAGYNLPMGFKVIGSVAGKHQDRSVPVAPPLYVPYRDTHLDQWDYTVELRRGLSETINGSLSYVYSTRDGSGYTDINDPPAFTENGINPMHIADRNRSKIRAKLDWTPVNNLSVMGVAEYAKDTYPQDANRPYGLKKGKGQFYSLDATYQFTPDWQLVGWYAYDQTDADQYAGRWCRESGSVSTGVCTPANTPPVLEGTKYAQLKDKNNTLGASLKGKVNAKLKIGADVLWTQAKANYNESWTPTNLPGGNSARYYTSGGVTEQELPNIKTELTRFGVFADYAVQKNGSLRLDVIYEHWKTNDWSYSFADGNPFMFGNAAGTNQDGTYFVQDSPQNATFVGLRYKYMLD